jgi:hypothetical protein
MDLARTGLLLTVVALWMAPVMAQTRQPKCLHGETETDLQAQRRLEALDAADVIIGIIDRRPRGTGYPSSWEAVGELPGVAAYRGIAGARGDLVRKIQWGSDEPLPGWRVHYVGAPGGYAFSLTDIRDPCQLTFASNDTGVVVEGRPADRRGQVRVIPLDSTH